MVKNTLHFLLGILVTTLLVINLIVIPIFVIIVALLRLLLPIRRVKNAVNYFLQDIVTWVYIKINEGILKLTGTKWEIKSESELRKNGWYFLVSNHQSWLDILVLQISFNGKIPMLKFFMKQELLWTIPIGGLSVYLLDFPFMKRHSKEYLRKNSGQRDKDMQTTKKKCEKYKDIPTTIMNFLEGTRFTAEKHKTRSSPYKNLLPPKAGGMAFVLEAMNGTLKEIIDTTIVYNSPNISFWDFLCGKLDKITLNYEVIPIPDEIVGDYYHDKAFRRQFQQWLNNRWQMKDELINSLSESP